MANLLSRLIARAAANREALAERLNSKKMRVAIDNARSNIQSDRQKQRNNYIHFTRVKREIAATASNSKLYVTTIDISNGAGDSTSQPLPTDWTYITGVSQNPDGTWNYARITWTKTFSISFAASYGSGQAESEIPSNYEEYKKFSDIDVAAYGDGFSQQYGAAGRVYFYQAVTQQVVSATIAYFPVPDTGLGQYRVDTVTRSYVDRNPIALPANYVRKGTYAINRDNLFNTLNNIQTPLYTANIINIVRSYAHENTYILPGPTLGVGYAFAEVYATPPSIVTRSSTSRDYIILDANNAHTQELVNFINKPDTYIMNYASGGPSLDQTTVVSMRQPTNVNYSSFMADVLNKRIRLITFDVTSSLVLPVFLNKNKNIDATVRRNLVDSYAYYYSRQLTGGEYIPNPESFLGSDWQSYVTLSPGITIEQLRAAYTTTLKATDFIFL